jgi:hypothetical protein
MLPGSIDAGARREELERATATRMDIPWIFLSCFASAITFHQQSPTEARWTGSPSDVVPRDGGGSQLKMTSTNDNIRRETWCSLPPARDRHGSGITVKSSSSDI